MMKGTVMHARPELHRANPRQSRGFRIARVVRMMRAPLRVAYSIHADTREILCARIVVRAMREKEKRATNSVARCIVPKC
jgi:hypothetical protein